MLRQGVAKAFRHISAGPRRFPGSRLGVGLRPFARAFSAEQKDGTEPPKRKPRQSTASTIDMSKMRLPEGFSIENDDGGKGESIGLGKGAGAEAAPGGQGEELWGQHKAEKARELNRQRRQAARVRKEKGDELGEAEKDEEEEEAYARPKTVEEQNGNTTKAIFAALAVLVGGAAYYFRDPEYRITTSMEWIIGMLEREDPTMVLHYLNFTLTDEIANSYFIGLGGVKALLKIAENYTGDDEQIPGGALMVLANLSSNVRCRAQICGDKEFVPRLLKLITSSKQKQTVLQALNVLYNYLGDEDWFYEDFIKLKGFDIMLRASRSSEPEVANFSSQLMAMFCIAHPAYLKSRKLGDAEVNTIFQSLFQMAQIYQENGKHEHAISAYEQIVKLDRKNPTILCQLGIEHCAMGDLEKGAENLKLSLELNPIQLEASFALARILLAKGKDKANMKQAVDLLLGGLDELNKPNAQFAGAKHPIGPRVYDLLVECYMTMGDLRSGLTVAQDWSVNYHNEAKAHLAVGQILTKQHSYRQALGPLRQALDLNPRMGLAQYNRALCLYNLGRTELAIQMCKEGVRIESENRDSHYQRLEYNQRRAIQATDKAEKAKGTPQSIEAAAAAVAAVRTAESQAKDKAECVPPMYLLLGKLLGAKGEWAEAEGYYTQLTRAAPGLPAGYYNLALARDKLGHKEQADQAFEAAVRAWSIQAKKKGTLPKADLKALKALQPRATSPAAPGSSEGSARAKLAEAFSVLKTALPNAGL